MNRQVQMGGLYRHFKGFVVKVLGLAKHTETGEILVICELYAQHFPKPEPDYREDIYARPIDMFLSEVDRKKYPNVKQKYRFELIKELEDNA